MTPPETRYAKSGDVHIAYQVTGTGPFDLVWVPGFVSNVELQWDFPEAPRFISRLASFCRLIRFENSGLAYPTAQLAYQRWKNEWTMCARLWTR